MNTVLPSLLFSFVSAGTASALEAQGRGSGWTGDCDSWGRRSRVRVCEARELGMRPPGRLTVDGGMNGAVTVLGWDRDSIHVVAHIEASGRSQDEARELAGGIRIVRSGGEIYAEGPGLGRGTGWAVSFEIRVPKRTDLSLRSVNGGVDVEDVTGSMDLRAQNGPVTLVAVGGDVKARAVNGPLAIHLAGGRWDGTGLDAETVNGPVELEIPGGYSAQLETGTVQGPFESDAPLTVTLRGRRSSRITSVLGSGGAPVRAVTTNGPVQIRRS